MNENELLKYLKATKLKDWVFKKIGEHGTILISDDRVMSIALIEEYANVIKAGPSEAHFYNSLHLNRLQTIVEKLELIDFEIIKDPMKPLALKTDFFYLSIAPRVIDEEEEEF